MDLLEIFSYRFMGSRQVAVGWLFFFGFFSAPIAADWCSHPVKVE
jgi:hypothetical protein